MPNPTDREPQAPSLKYPGVRDLVLSLRPKLRNGFQLGDAKTILAQVGQAMVAQGIPQHVPRTQAGVDIPDTPVGLIAAVLKENPELGHLLYNDLFAGFLHDRDAYAPDITGQFSDELMTRKAEKMRTILEAFGFDKELPVIETALVMSENDLRTESIRIHGIQCFKREDEKGAAGTEARPEFYEQMQAETRASLKTRRMAQILASWFDVLLIRDIGVPMMNKVGFDSMAPEEDPRDGIRAQVKEVTE